MCSVLHDWDSLALRVGDEARDASVPARRDGRYRNSRTTVVPRLFGKSCQSIRFSPLYRG
jgi:hypothetical protein